MARAASLIRERFGAPVVPFVNRQLSSVGTTAAQLLINDPDRLGFLVVNLAAVSMFAGPFRDVSTSRGVRIGPSGGTLSVVWFEDFEIVAWEWFIVADAAASNLLAIEYLAG